MRDTYQITLKYYEGGVLSETYAIEKMIANEEDLEVTFGRNEQWEGSFQEFSNTIIFIKQDRAWIKAKHELYLSRLDEGTKVVAELETLNPTTVAYGLVYTGRLLMSSVDIQEYYAECQFEDESIISTLDAIQDKEYTIEKDGIIYPYDIKLNAVYDATSELAYNGVDVTSPQLQTSDGVIDDISGECFGVIVSGNSDAPLFEDYTRFENDEGNSLAKITPREGVEKINLSGFAFGINIGTLVSSDVVINCEMIINAKIYQSDILSETRNITSLTRPSLDTNTYWRSVFNNAELDIDFTIDRSSENESEWTRIEFEYEFAGQFDRVALIQYAYFYDNEDGIFTMDFGDSLKTSAIVAHPLRDILDDYETATGLTINTDYVDGTIYDTDVTLLTTSRGVKGITPLNYNFSFKDYFKSSKAFQALSLRESGGIIYIESIYSAYVDTEAELSAPKKMQIMQNDKIYNFLNIGNSGGGSSNFDYGDLEFNAKAEYGLGINTEDNKEFSNKVRVDGATINKAAIDYERLTYSIADRDEDKDLYFIARDSAETDVQSQFTLVSGVDADKFGQAINMEYSRSRQLWNWRHYIQHLTTGNSTFTLSSWDKNKELVYTDSDRATNVTDTPTTITDFGGTAIFGKRKFVVTLAYKSNQYSFIKDNRNNKFTWEYEGVTYYGWLEKVSVNPIASGEITMELTEAV